MARYQKIKLPSNYHPHDEKWLIEQLQKLSEKDRVTARIGYNEVYTKVYTEESIVYRKGNSARKAANVRLRKFIDKARNNQETKEIRKPSYNNNDFSGY